MKESVFLSKKKVVLAEVLTGATQDELGKNLAILLTKPITVQDRGEQVVDRGMYCSVVSFGDMTLADGRKGYIFSVSYRGTPVCGMYFFREGDNFLTEMVDPNSHSSKRGFTQVWGERS